MVQLDNLTELYPHPKPFGGVVTLGVEPCLAVLGLIPVAVTKFGNAQNLSIACRWDFLAPSYF